MMGATSGGMEERMSYTVSGDRLPDQIHAFELAKASFHVLQFTR